MESYDFNSFDLALYLESKGLRFKQVSGGSEYLVHCIDPNHEDKSSHGKMYVHAFGDNKGLYQCKSAECGASGNLITMMRHFGDDPDGLVPKGSSVSVSKVRGDFATMCHESLSLEMLDYLADRGIEEGSAVKFRLGETPKSPHKMMRDRGHSEEDLIRAGLVDSDGNFFFRAGSMIIPYLVGRDVVTLRARNFTDGAPKYIGLNSDAGFLFNSNDCQSLEDVIYVCEGELDAMTLSQAGFAVVATAGASSWFDDWSTVLSDFPHVYFVYDGEDGAFKYATVAADRVGSTATALRLPDGIDVNQFFQDEGKSAFESFVSRQLEESFPFKTLEYHLAEWNLYLNSGEQWLKTGYKQIDDSLPVGILPNQLIIWIAKPSVGKTQFAINMLYRQMVMYPDKKFLFFSLELKGYEVLDRLVKIHRFYDLGSETIQDSLRFFQDRVLIFDDNRITRDDLWRHTTTYLEKYGEPPAAAYLDYLGYFANSYKGDGSYEKVSSAAADLKGWAKDFSIPMFVPHQTTKANKPGETLDIDAGADSAKVSAAADYMFTMSWADQMGGASQEEMTGEVVAKVVKNRAGPAHIEMKLQRAPYSYVFAAGTNYEKPQKQGLDPFLMAKKEYKWSQAKHNYETAMGRHRTQDDNLIVVGKGK